MQVLYEAWRASTVSLHSTVNSIALIVFGLLVLKEMKKMRLAILAIPGLVDAQKLLARVGEIESDAAMSRTEIRGSVAEVKQLVLDREMVFESYRRTALEVSEAQLQETRKHRLATERQNRQLHWVIMTLQQRPCVVDATGRCPIPPPPEDAIPEEPEIALGEEEK